jgi:tryptophan synthase alpha chain
MNANKIRLMAHLVAGFPDESGCRAAARGLVEGGAAYLEVQIPFSDPSADGPSIRDACSVSLERGATVHGAFRLVQELHAAYPNTPIFIMAYASLVATPGSKAFVEMAMDAGAAGLIVPDLPFDSDEGLAVACAAASSDNSTICAVPVAAPSMKPERLATMVSLGREFLYAALRSGITGSSTEIGKETKDFLDAAASGGAKVLGGFGIRTRDQAEIVAPHVHAIVAGSVFVDAIGKVAAEFRAESRNYAPPPAGRGEAKRPKIPGQPTGHV